MTHNCESREMYQLPLLSRDRETGVNDWLMWTNSWTGPTIKARLAVCSVCFILRFLNSCSIFRITSYSV